MTESRARSGHRNSAVANRGTGRSGDDGDPVVSVRNLRKVYGNAENGVEAVSGISFSIESGTVVGILGPNGAGKSTTIKSLLGLVVPTSGTVEVCGVDVTAAPSVAHEHVGAMLEGARNVYWRLTVRENLRFFAALGGRIPGTMTERHEELLAQFDLEEKADTAVRELSQGQKQKVSLACTLACDADVVFLDEPTLGLDVESSVELRRELRRLVDDDGVTVLLSSHDMDVVEAVCDRVIIMNDGRVVAEDTVENLLGLFDVQSYEITVEDELIPELREELVAEFDATDFEALPSGTRFRAQVTGDDFYSLIERLRRADLSVSSFDTVEPNLKETFLRVTSENEARSDSR